MKLSQLDSIFNIVLPVLVLFLLLTGCAVTGEEESRITVLPELAVVTLGGTETFSVKPAGTAVTWSVEGILGGNEGTIDTAGKYTAPTDANVAPEQVEIIATDTTGTSSSATALLTTFKSNKQLTKYTAGQFEADTYSAGQKNIAVYKEADTGDINIYAVWSDNHYSGSYKVYFTKSGNGGSTFDDPILVDDTSPGEQFSPAIATDDKGDVYIVWEDRRQGASDIVFRKYDSKNAIFNSIKQIIANTEVADYNKAPSIAIYDGDIDEIYIAWEHYNNIYDNLPDIYFAWSDNLGDSFLAMPYLSLFGRRPVVAMDSSGVAYVVWEDLDEGLSQFPSIPTHVRLMKISGGNPGDAWDFEVASGYNARSPSLAVDPVCKTSDDTICDVYVVWQRALISKPGFENEVINSYNIDLTIINGGTLKIINPTRLVPGSGSLGIVANKAYPAVAVDDSNIYIVWDDLAGEAKNVYLTKSSDGKDFSTKRIVNDDVGNNSSGISWHEKPGIAVANGKAYVIWTDYRDTQLSTETTVIPTDVFFAVEQ